MEPADAGDLAVGADALVAGRSQRRRESRTRPGWAARWHVDLDVIRAWWSLRSLRAARWLVEHGFAPSSPGCEFDLLRSQL